MEMGIAPARFFDELDAELVQCPYDLYRSFQEGPPVYVDAVRAVVVSRFADVQRVISDAAAFSSAQVRGPVSIEAMTEVLGGLAAEDPEMAALMERNQFMTRFLLAADGEDHRRRRGLVQKAFTPRRIRVMEPMIESIVERLIDGFAERGRANFVAEFAIPLPIEVIARAIGVDDADIGDFKRWSDDLFAPAGVNRPDREMMIAFLRSQDAFTRYFSQRIDERREGGRDDLLQDLLGAELDGERLTREESMLMCAELTAAGNETTTSMLASAAQILGDHPGLQEELRAEPARIPAFVEEVLRLEGPIQAFYRTAVEDTEVGGTPVAAGTALLCLYAAANRDAEQFECPVEIDTARPNGKTHTAFGRGPHACVGSLLARTEGRIAVEALLRRLDRIEVTRAPRAGEYTPSYMLRGPRRLEISFA
ncbi:MAG: cytochrome P450 [Solirubrobacterales bacterium]